MSRSLHSTANSTVTSNKMQNPPTPTSTASSLRHVLALSHIFNGVSSGAAVAIGLVVTAWYLHLPIDIVTMLKAMLATMLSSSAGFIINDIVDIDIDRVNRPDRPLAAGQIPVSLAWGLFGAYNIIALLLALTINIQSVIMVLLVELALTLYSISFKKIFLLGHVTIAALGASLIPFGGLAIGSAIPGVYTVPFVFAAFFAREVLKTVPDVEGDRANGVDNIATRYGPVPAVRLGQAVLALTAISLLLVRFVWTTLNPWFTIIVIVLIWPLSAYTVLRSSKVDLRDMSNIKETLRLSKMLFLLVAAAFLIGSIG